MLPSSKSVDRQERTDFSPIVTKQTTFTLWIHTFGVYIDTGQRSNKEKWNETLCECVDFSQSYIFWVRPYSRLRSSKATTLCHRKYRTLIDLSFYLFGCDFFLPSLCPLSVSNSHRYHVPVIESMPFKPMLFSLAHSSYLSPLPTLTLFKELSLSLSDRFFSLFSQFATFSLHRSMKYNIQFAIRLGVFFLCRCRLHRIFHFSEHFPFGRKFNLNN